ncbi:hypothetical protein KKH3_14420 [Pectobacterium actinidiae]|nr:hypothetical protein KKH3_14420 [Pectobacterium actinidiae]
MEMQALSIHLSFFTLPCAEIVRSPLPLFPNKVMFNVGAA